MTLWVLTRYPRAGTFHVEAAMHDECIIFLQSDRSTIQKQKLADSLGLPRTKYIFIPVFHFGIMIPIKRFCSLKYKRKDVVYV